MCNSIGCLLLVQLVLSCTLQTAEGIDRKECIGSEDRNQGHRLNDAANRYKRYRKMYENCTHVLKSLEIVFLDEEDNYDMSFLQNIQEVNGYVYILGNHFDYLPLQNLRVIRGRPLLRQQRIPSRPEQPTDVSLYVALNSKENSSTVGLKEIQLPSLHEIMDGDVLFLDNRLLCYVETIEWKDVFGDRSTAEVWSENRFPSQCDVTCHSNCSMTNVSHVSTSSPRCWGAGPNMCQRLSKYSCHSHCKGNCFGPSENDCCDPQCVGGCSGHRNSQCWSCRSFSDSGTCVAQCPPVMKYNPYIFRNEENPNGKYAYGARCINNCSSVNMLADMGGCVQSCRQGHQAVNGRCVPCSGSCDKICNGTDGDTRVDSHNIESFRDCTVIDGSLNILDVTFTGDPKFNKTGVTIDQLSVFESVQQINGFLLIQGMRPEMTSLSFFRNLQIIKGNRLYNNEYSLAIHNTLLHYLGLVSLKQVSGKIIIVKNRQLCFLTTIDWTKISSSNRTLPRATPATCGRCSDQCVDASGCWGPDDNHCQLCKHYRFKEFCVSECSKEHLTAKFNISSTTNGLALYQVNSTNSGEKHCKPCHSECSETCSGEGADQCKSCLHYKDGPFCVAQCPTTKYPDSRGICQPCSSVCHADYGCTGPGNLIGPGGCRLCKDYIFDYFNQTMMPSNALITATEWPWSPRQCMLPEDECPTGFFSDRAKVEIEAKSEIGGTPTKVWAHMCKKCHHECLQCEDSSTSDCRVCRNKHLFTTGECVPACPSEGYYVDASADNDTCLPCDAQCLSCYGPTEFHCTKCRFNRVYVEDLIVNQEGRYNVTNLEQFSNNDTLPESFCVKKCPDEVRISSRDVEKMEDRCGGSSPRPQSVVGDSDGNIKETDKKIIIAIAAVTLTLSVVVVGIVVARYYKSSQETAKMSFEARITGCPDVDQPMGQEYIASTIVADSALKPPKPLEKQTIVERESLRLLRDVSCQSDRTSQWDFFAPCSANFDKFVNLFIIVVVIIPIDDDEIEMNCNIKPDMASLRLINESELRQGEMIGAGAFGAVFQGVWIPSGERVKMRVAIKVLHEGVSHDKNKDILEEARIMASVQHACCMRIIAISMTAQIKLVTQLMPLGCLLTYVQSKVDNIGSRTFLHWATQIADGMRYLEELGIVHRDLAARNILLKTVSQVKITDFGLAKLVNDSENQTCSARGKMPIKWLALESILDRVYNHKTDVWSFGVTLWEMFTYGQKPYEAVPPLQMADILEKGERLHQPKICTIDIYMLLIKCWMVDADSRPTFAELYGELSKMSKDPGRYLVVPGDKLMRLPSNSPRADIDRAELWESAADDINCWEDIGVDVVAVNVEDYLHPKYVNASAEHQLLSTSCSSYQAENYENAANLLATDNMLYGFDDYSPNQNKHNLLQRQFSQQYGTAKPTLPATAAAAAASVYGYENNYLEPPTRLANKTYLEVVDDNGSTAKPGCTAARQQQLMATADNPEYFTTVSSAT